MVVKTAIIMLNMGGPKVSRESKQYLFNLFNDKEIIDIPFRNFLAPIISKFRGKKLEEKYNLIGGGSPIHKWTHIQGKNMCIKLNRISPSTAPHKYYIGFRYVSPFIDESLDNVIIDNVDRLILFSQYPQYSCTTSGSSFNEAAKWISQKDGLNPKISIIDR
ncbi:hypothetical protein HZS_5951, partial [Henneguya salminicola]